MAKKDKKKKNTGITYESQQAALESIDKLVFGGDDSLLQVDISNHDSDYADMNEQEFSSSIDSLIRQRRKARQEIVDESPDKKDEPETKIDVSDIIGSDDSDTHEMQEYFDELDKRLESEASDEDNDGIEPDSEEESDEPVFRDVKISILFTDVYKIVKFDDGIRDVTIDLNTLTADEFELPNNEFINPQIIAMMRLEEVMHNFYPSMLMSSDRFNSYMRHVSQFESAQFKFFEFDDEDANNNMIAGYYISEQSMLLYNQLVDELNNNGYLVSFLNALLYATDFQGFAFNMIPTSHIRQIMITEDMESNSQEFMSMMMNDDTIKIDEDCFNETAGEVVDILSHDFLNASIDKILKSDLENEEDTGDLELSSSSEDEDENAGETVEITPAEVVPVNHPEEGELEPESDDGDSPAPVVEEAAAESENLFDGMEDAVDVNDDPEELERQYYTSKGKKPPQAKPVQKKKADDDDDSKWTIKRRY